MIKKLKVRNFRSLKDFEVDFGKFNVLIGKNNSGKSNIIDCIKFLSDFTGARNLNEAIRKRGRYKDIVYSLNDKNIISISVNVVFVDSESGEEEFEYELSFSGVNENIRIEKEEIRIKNGANEKTIRWKENKEDGKSFKSLVVISDGIEKETARSDISMPILMYMLNFPEGISKQLFKFFRFMENAKLYEFNPKKMKRILQPLQSYIVDEDGHNISQVIYTLHLENKQILDRISELLCEVVDDLDSGGLVIVPAGDKIYLAIKEKRFEEPFPLWIMSYGTLKMIGHIVSLHTTDFFEFPYGSYKTKIKNPLFCFEEPENNIYPKIFEFLVDLMRKSDAQIILTTHSPDIVNLVNENDLIILRKGDDGTKALRTAEKIRELKKSYSLNTGEMWMSGVLTEFFGER